MKKTLFLCLTFWLNFNALTAQNILDGSFEFKPDNPLNASFAGDMGAGLFGQPTDKLRGGFSSYKETSDRYGKSFQQGLWFDMPLKYDGNEKNYFGIGAFFYYNRALFDKTFLNFDDRYQVAGLSFAYHHKLNKSGTLRLNEGLEFVGMRQKKFKDKSDLGSNSSGYVTSRYGYPTVSITVSKYFNDDVVYLGVSSPTPLVIGKLPVFNYYWLPNPVLYAMANVKLNKQLSILPGASLNLLGGGGISYYVGSDIAYTLGNDNPRKSIGIYAGAQLYHQTTFTANYYIYSGGICLPYGFQLGLSKGLINDGNNILTHTFQFDLRLNLHKG